MEKREKDRERGGKERKTEREAALVSPIESQWDFPP